MSLVSTTPPGSAERPSDEDGEGDSGDAVVESVGGVAGVHDEPGSKARFRVVLLSVARWRASAAARVWLTTALSKSCTGAAGSLRERGRGVVVVGGCEEPGRRGVAWGGV